MNKNDKFHDPEIKLNAHSISDEELESVSGGTLYTYCCGICNTPLKITRTEDYQMLGFCPSCNSYPDEWVGIRKKS